LVGQWKVDVVKKLPLSPEHNEMNADGIATMLAELDEDGSGEITVELDLKRNLEGKSYGVVMDGFEETFDKPGDKDKFDACFERGSFTHAGTPTDHQANISYSMKPGFQQDPSIAGQCDESGSIRFEVRLKPKVRSDHTPEAIAAVAGRVALKLMVKITFSPIDVKIRVKEKDSNPLENAEVVLRPPDCPGESKKSDAKGEVLFHVAGKALPPQNPYQIRCIYDVFRQGVLFDSDGAEQNTNPNQVQLSNQNKEIDVTVTLTRHTPIAVLYFQISMLPEVPGHAAVIIGSNIYTFEVPFAAHQDVIAFLSGELILDRSKTGASGWKVVPTKDYITGDHNAWRPAIIQELDPRIFNPELALRHIIQSMAIGDQYMGYGGACSHQAEAALRASSNTVFTGVPDIMGFAGFDTPWKLYKFIEAHGKPLQTYYIWPEPYANLNTTIWTLKNRYRSYRKIKDAFDSWGTFRENRDPNIYKW